MGAGFAFFSLHGALFPEGNVGFACLAAAASCHAFAVAFLFLCEFACFRLFALGVFEAFADAGGVLVSCRGDGPGSGTAGFGDGQTEHLRVDETHLAVEQIADGGKERLGREEPGVAQFNGESQAYVLCLQTHASDFPQGDAFLRLFFRGTESRCAQQEEAITNLAAEFFHQFTHLGAGVEAVVLHLDEPEFLLAGVVEDEVHLLAAVAEVLGVVGVEGGAFEAAYVIACFEIEAVQSFNAAGTRLEHGQISSLSWGMRLR